MVAGKRSEKYLGPGHRVLASYGHVRDLPPKDGSVDPDQGFAMEWETYADKARQLKAITDEAKGADTLILATDPDREGEAISWHVQEVLKKRRALPSDVQRVTFNAITKPAVLEAMANPRALDEDLKRGVVRPRRPVQDGNPQANGGGRGGAAAAAPAAPAGGRAGGAPVEGDQER
jgi:DNA topoisomerase IA